MESPRLTRREDWPMRLSAFLTERAAMPFIWGQNDCMMLAADAVLALTDTDLAADLRGTYDTAELAGDEMAGFGTSVEDILDARLGISKPLANAMRGDIVTFEGADGICAGVLDDSGRRVALVSKEQGLVRIPLARCRYAWGY